jgi:DNA-binding transcriptional LysR family regulator
LYLSDTEKEQHPQIRFREHSYSGLVRAVEAGEVDFGVGGVPLKPDLATARGRVTIKGLGYKVERGFICHREYHLARPNVTKEELAADVEFRLVGGIPRLQQWLPMRELAAGQIVEVTNFSVALAYIKLGLGFAVVPYLPGEIANSVKSENVYYQPLPELGQAEVAIYLPADRVRVLSRSAKEILDWVKRYFTDRRSSSPLRPSVGS